MSNQSLITRFTLLIAALTFCVSAALAQATNFSYQGKLTDSGTPANGAFDLQFKLFDNSVGGAQQGATATLDNVVVTNGVFTVQLDFGAAFPGGARFLEIGVRPGVSVGAFTLLTPRQPINSTPYAIRSLNAGSADALSAACVGCVTNNQIGSLPTGSGNYIQNSAALQASSNFNISGNGTAGGTLSGNIVNATTQFNLNGDRILSNAGGFGVNLFAGAGAGSSNTSGTSNSFFGSNAGIANTDGSVNSFFGGLAGDSNTHGNNNSFFGGGAGSANTTGGSNAIFGASAGSSNTTASNNAIFGASTGSANSTGDSNAFFGASSATSNTTGRSNAFFGHAAGNANTTGSNNTVIGDFANVGSNNLTFATAIGAGAVVSNSNSVVLGRAVDTVQVPGAATVTGNLTISGNTIITLGAAGATAVCRNASNQLSTCSSSRRYKENILAYRAGLQLVNGLRPVAFDWKADRQHDLGLVAEDVAALEPLLATYNDKGEVEGVKYDRVAVVLLNAVKEQQQQIEQLQAEKVALAQRLSALEKLVQQNQSTKPAGRRAVR